MKKNGPGGGKLPAKKGKTKSPAGKKKSPVKDKASIENSQAKKWKRNLPEPLSEEKPNEGDDQESPKKEKEMTVENIEMNTRVRTGVIKGIEIEPAQGVS